MSELNDARTHFIQAMSQIGHFWGFPKAMGAIYGAIYLSPDPVTLDELVDRVGVSKGAVSTNVRKLERLNMVHKQIKVGDRKDYYIPEPNFWKVLQGVLRQRQSSEFDLALQAVDESLEIIKASDEDEDLAQFYQERIERMSAFFKTLDRIVSAIAALDEFRLSTLHKLLGNNKD